MMYAHLQDREITNLTLYVISPFFFFISYCWYWLVVSRINQNVIYGQISFIFRVVPLSNVQEDRKLTWAFIVFTCIHTFFSYNKLLQEYTLYLKYL